MHLAAKSEVVLRLGVHEVWLVDPRRRTVTIGRSDRPVLTVHRSLVWEPPAAASLRVDLAELFRGLPRE